MRRSFPLIPSAVLLFISACGGSPEPPPQVPEAPPPPAPVSSLPAASVSAAPPPAASVPPAPPPPSAPPAPPKDENPAPAADKPSADSNQVPGANLRVEGMEVDGVLIETLSCKVDGVGLLGAMVVGATLAKQRGALRACGLKAAVPVGWTIRRGSASEATASSGDAKKDACIVRALKQIKSTDDGVCRAKVGLK